ncbi:ribosomal protein S18-alanine N-acetyltransferase [Porticoccus sp.]|nr:ribosomal protein S18-alanine N-acetyltransferase [Porticoccus sp.]
MNLDHVSIRPMSLIDINEVSYIEKIATPYPWRKEQFTDSHKKHTCLIMAIGSSIIGYVIYNTVVDDAEVINIAIHPEYQHNGYGRYLLEYLISILPKSTKRFFLEVRVTNTNAIYLYEDIGFVAICERKNYYRSASKTEDAILMALEL